MIAAPPASWNPHIALLMGRILCLKNYPRYPNIDGTAYIQTVWQQTSNQARFILLENCVDSSIVNKLLDKFDQAAIELQQGVEYGGTTLNQPQIHWADKISFNIERSASFILAAMKAGLGPYVEAKLSKDPSLFHDHFQDPILAHNSLFRYGADMNCAWRFFIMLFKHGANPNKKFHGHSIWEYWLNFMHGMYSDPKEQSWSKEERRQAEDILEVFLHHGADLDATCISDYIFWERVEHESGYRFPKFEFDFDALVKKLGNHFPRAVISEERLSYGRSYPESEDYDGYLSGESEDPDGSAFASDPANHSV
jgi:hypothetical protein